MTIKPTQRPWIMPGQVLTHLHPGQRVAFVSEVEPGRQVRLCGFVNEYGRIEDTRSVRHDFVLQITPIPAEHARGDWTPEDWTERGVLPFDSAAPAVLIITDTQTGQEWRITAPFGADADRYNKNLFLLYTRRAWRAGIGHHKIEAEYE